MRMGLHPTDSRWEFGEYEKDFRLFQGLIASLLGKGCNEGVLNVFGKLLQFGVEHTLGFAFDPNPFGNHYQDGLFIVLTFDHHGKALHFLSRGVDFVPPLFGVPGCFLGFHPICDDQFNFAGLAFVGPFKFRNGLRLGFFFKALKGEAADGINK